jgi:hypothetical protein
MSNIAIHCCFCLLIIVTLSVSRALGQTLAQAAQSPQDSSSQFIASSGLSVQQLMDAPFQRRADLIAARQRLAIAQGNLIQAVLRPNPQLKTEYGSTAFLNPGPQPESEVFVGVTQVFETGGKRSKRVARR